MSEQNKKNVIDLSKVAKTLWAKKRTFVKVWVIVFILSVIWIMPQPRSYTCNVSLAPELMGDNIAGGLSSIASSFGFDIGSGGGYDAIYPTLYPDLMESNRFVVDLMSIEVTTMDNELTTDYYTYLTKHQKKNWLTWPFKKLTYIVKGWFSSKKSGPGENAKLDAFRLSEYDFRLVESVKKKILCSVDKKTEVVTITVKDQDPLICATMADSACKHLQDYIIAYRTSKARLDVEHFTRLVENSKKDYDEALLKYSLFYDNNKGAVRQTILAEMTKLENDMQLKLNTYNAMCTQLEMAKSKLQEFTPAFTVLQTATVPIKPSEPKRMIFVAGMLILSTMVAAFWMVRKQLITSVDNDN